MSLAIPRSWLDLRGDGRDKGIGKDRREGVAVGRGQKKERSQREVEGLASSSR